MIWDHPWATPQQQGSIYKESILPQKYRPIEWEFKHSFNEETVLAGEGIKMDNTHKEVGSLNDVINATFDARSQWYFIGLELGVDDNTLRAFRGQFHGNPIKECHQEMLSYFFNRGSLQWIHIVQALRSPSVGYSDLANRIAREHNLPEEEMPIQIARPQEEEIDTATLLPLIPGTLLLCTQYICTVVSPIMKYELYTCETC